MPATNLLETPNRPAHRVGRFLLVAATLISAGLAPISAAAGANTDAPEQPRGSSSVPLHLSTPRVPLLLSSASTSGDATNAWRGRPEDTPASQPTSKPRGPVTFQPGVRIDWSRREVLVDTQVVLRSGGLEFLACFPGKEHESILRCRASAVHIYMALGLIGLDAGHPPRWNEARGKYDPPTGALVDIAFEWRDDGQTRRDDAYDWLREYEYGLPPIARPWVFGGSVSLADGTSASDASGAGVALVDKSDALISYTRSFPSSLDELWVCANTKAIPPLKTSVTMVIRAARPRTYVAEMDFRGALTVNGRVVSAGDFADLLRSARRRRPDHIQTITTDRPLRADLRGLLKKLDAGGIPEQAVRFVPADRVPTVDTDDTSSRPD